MMNRPAKAFKVLLDAGADVNARHDNGDTALHMGFFLGDDPEAVRLLIDHGISVTVTNHRKVFISGTVSPARPYTQP